MRDQCGAKNCKVSKDFWQLLYVKRLVFPNQMRVCVCKKHPIKVAIFTLLTNLSTVECRHQAYMHTAKSR